MNHPNHKTPAIHHRRSIRLQEYDYAQAGAYFITICTHNHQPIFGKIELDPIGQPASAQNGRGQPVGAGLAPAQNGKGQPVGAGLAPAQNGNGQPPGLGQPRGLPLQDSNNTVMGAGVGQPVGAGLSPAQDNHSENQWARVNRAPTDFLRYVGQPQGLEQPPGSGQPQGLPLQDSNNAIIGADNGQPVGAGLAPAQNGNGQPRGLARQDSNNACAHMELNEFGQIALEQWYKLADRFQNIELDAFVVMPNHVHGIIFITENGQQQQRGQSRDGQPPGSGQPRGLPLQDSNNAVMGADIGQPRDGQPRGLPLQDSNNAIIVADIGQPRDGQPQGLPLQDSNNAIIGAGVGQPVGAGLAPARNGIGQPQGLPLPKRVTLGDIVGAYKSLVSNECLKIYKTKNETMGKLWQRNYYEHIIRDEKSYENIVYYIENNPSTWQQDELFGGEIL